MPLALKNLNQNLEPNRSSLITLTDICKSYQLGQTKVHALRNINLTIEAGEFTCIVGASGSGKTTLLNIIGCIDRADSGTYSIDSVDVHSLDEDQKSSLRNTKIGFIFQTFNLVPVLSVYENIELPLLINPGISRQERDALIMSSLEDVGLQDKRNNRPDQLSGGQRQRVAIARALAGNPALVLADEPTANLDSLNSHKIIDTMLELNQKRRITFIFSTHDDKLMSRTTRKVVIKDGVVAL